MANEDVLARLRRLTGEDPEADSAYTTTQLQVILDEVRGDINLAASRIWGEKASDVADEINMSEAGSSRSGSDLFDHAVKQRDYFASIASTGSEIPVQPSTTVRKIERV